MSATKRLVVCGGSGFLGSRICKFAVARGWEVTSISRAGTPQWDAITASASPPSWSHKVSWERGDIFKPATYTALLKGADYVVHSMGILLEADYKGVISGQESPIAGLQKAFAAAPGRTANPMEKDLGDDVSTSNPKDQFTYEVMNRDTAIALAKHAAADSASAFCYVSAAGGGPVLPARYITTKRETEATVTSQFPQMRGVYPRPPIMYDSSRKITMGMAALTGAGTIFNNLTGKMFSGFLGAAGAKPLQVDTVAEAIVEALSDEEVRGPIEVPQLEQLAQKGWRKTML